MGYSREAYDKVAEKLYATKMRATQELEKRKYLFYKRFPRAAEIEKELAKCSISAARIVMRGSDVKQTLLSLKQKNSKLKEELTSILKSVGLPENYLEIKYNCKECKDSGLIDGKMCKCMKNLLKAEAYERLNDMSPLKSCCFENFSLDYYSEFPVDQNGVSPKYRMSKILNYCKNYAKSFDLNSPGLLFIGKPGLGKTHLSLSIAHEIIGKGYSVIYSTIQNIVSKMEKDKFKSYSEIDDGTDHFLECDLLIIDDLGTEFPTAFSASAIYGLINSRIMFGRPSIISTNLSLKELQSNYSDRMVSRILGSNIKLEFLGSDIRQKIMSKRLSLS